MIRKGLAVVVILLFIGVAFAMPINANVSKMSLEQINVIEEVEEYDCGCEEDISELEWGYPVLCTLLYPLLVVSGVLFLLFHIRQFYFFMETLGNELNCFWASPWY